MDQEFFPLIGKRGEGATTEVMRVHEVLLEAARCLLYVPGSRPELVEKAAASGADALILDLEDAVLPSDRPRARAEVARLLSGPLPLPVLIRVNPQGTRDFELDLEALHPVASRTAFAGLRLTKVSSPGAVREVARSVCHWPSRIGLYCQIEDAAGVEGSGEIAKADPRVRGLTLGEADLRADLGVSVEGSDEGMLFVRSRLVVACRAAGLPAPVASVYPFVKDDEGLRASSLRLKSLGFRGRAAIHPRQVPVINEVFTPTAEEIDRARQVRRAAEEAAANGAAALALADGTFVDPAIVRWADAVLGIAERLSSER